jgi:RNA polymerase sigma-70 factor (ECF subfamily)
MPSDEPFEPEDLLPLARAGDGEALGQLLGTCRSYLKLLAQVQIDRRLSGKADASDVVQDTLLYAHQVFPSFRGRTEAELLGWLRRVLASKLKNLVRRYCEAQSRDVRLERRLEEELNRSSCAVHSLAAPDSTPSHEAMRQEGAVLVADAVTRLPDTYREVIVLRHLEDLAFAEVAQRMGRSEESVKKLWVRALAALRRTFGEHVDEHRS